MACVSELWLCRRLIHEGSTATSLPAGLLKRMAKRYFIGQPGLHLFCGDLHIPYAVNVDIRPAAKSDIIATSQHLPFPDDTFRWSFSDPPYSDAWSEKIWATGKVKLREVMAELVRVTAPGGLILWLDLRPWTWPRSLQTEAYIGVMAGPRRRIRLLHVLRKQML